MMNDVTVMFAPLNGEPYYLYQRKDGSKFMSLIMNGQKNESLRTTRNRI